MCTDEFHLEDRILLDLNCQDLEYPIYIAARKFKDYNVDQLFRKIMLINSQKKFKIDESFTLRITRCTLSLRGGRKRRYTHDSESRKRFANSIISIVVGQKLCLPAALYVGHYRLTHNIKQGEEHYTQWKKIIDQRNMVLN